MKTYKPLFLSIVLIALNAFADRYVSPPGGYGTNNPPYANWADAATNIQWAVNVATNNETVWVTNGNYALTNQIFVTNGAVLRSVNGRTNTFVNGNYPDCSNRCFYINNATSVVDGFMISNSWYSNSVSGGGGAVYIYRGLLKNCAVFSNWFYGDTNTYYGGGGVYLEKSDAVVSNCLIHGNTVVGGYGGGGVCMRGGKVLGCVVSNNNALLTSGGRGGGVLSFADNGSEVIDSEIVNNRAHTGGIMTYGNATVRGCKINNNYGDTYTIGAFFSRASLTVCENCTFSGNTGNLAVIYNNYDQNVIADCVISNNNGKGIYLSGGMVSNCIITGSSSYGIDIGTTNTRLYNNLIEKNQNNGIYLAYGDSVVSCCTIVSNYTSGTGGGIRISSTNPNVRIANCVVVSNAAAGGYNDLHGATAGKIHATNVNYSCAGSFAGFSGAGNVTNVSPLFTDFIGRNYRLVANSPCVNSGTNESWMTNSVDLDGRVRIRYGVVDMGAYETLYSGTMILVP